MALFYFIAIFGIIFLGIFSKTSDGARKYFPYIIMLSLAFMMGIRYDVGKDYLNYEEIYDNPYSYARYALEPLWLIFIDLLGSLSFKSRMFFFITSFLFVYGYYVGFKRISPHIYISFILFIVCDTFGEGANTIRQSCAQAVLFAGSRYFLLRQWRSFLPYAFFAVLLHFTALIGVALMCVCLIHISRPYLLLSLLTSFALGPVMMNLFASYIVPLMLIVGKYKYDVDTFDAGVSTGLLRYLYTFVGVLVLWLFKKRKEQPQYLYVLLNLVIMGILIYNTFYLFMPVNRLNRYCFPFITILLPMVCRNLEIRSRYIVETITVVCFLLFLMKSAVNLPYNFDLNFI